MNTAGLAPPNTDALGPHTRHCVGPSARCNCFGTDAPEQRPARRGVHRSRGRGDSLPQLDHRRPCGTPQAQQNRELRLSLASGGTCPLARGRPTVPPVAEGGRPPQGTSLTRVADDHRPRRSRSGWRGRQTWGDHPGRCVAGSGPSNRAGHERPCRPSDSGGCPGAHPERLRFSAQAAQARTPNIRICRFPSSREGDPFRRDRERVGSPEGMVLVHMNGTHVVVEPYCPHAEVRVGRRLPRSAAR